MRISLTYHNFFSLYILNPVAKTLSPKDQCIAFLASFAIGLVSLGISHLSICLHNSKLRKLPFHPKATKTQKIALSEIKQTGSGGNASLDQDGHYQKKKEKFLKSLKIISEARKVRNFYLETGDQGSCFLVPEKNPPHLESLTFENTLQPNYGHYPKGNGEKVLQVEAAALNPEEINVFYGDTFLAVLRKKSQFGPMPLYNSLLVVETEDRPQYSDFILDVSYQMGILSIRYM